MCCSYTHVTYTHVEQPLAVPNLIMMCGGNVCVMTAGDVVDSFLDATITLAWGTGQGFEPTSLI